MLLNVQLKNDFPRIEGVAAVPDGFTVPDPLTKPTAWKLDPGALDSIPAWAPYFYGQPIKEIVRKSRQVAGERKVKQAGAPAGAPVGSQVGGEQYATTEQDIPF